MASNPGGPGPWGSGGPHSVPPNGDNDGPHGPGGPWGPGNWRPGGGGRVPPPELDQIIARIQAAIRGVLGRGPGGGFGTGHRGLLLLGIGVIAIWLASGFYRVEPDEQGVVLRFGAFNRTTLPGLNYHLPWPIESADTPAVTRINRTEIGYRSGPSEDESAGAAGRREIPAESLMLTGDENIIDIDLTILWRIDNAFNYLFNTRAPDVTVKAVAESVLREVMGRTPIQPALGPMRAQIAGDVMEQTQKILNGYQAGVQITQVLLQKADPPAAVVESFRDVQRANTDAERLRNEAQAYANDIVPRARGDAARVIAAGQGEKQATIALATGETKRFLSVLAAYRTAKDVTLERMYLDTMRDILIRAPTIVLDDKVKGLLPYLQVDGVSPPPPPTPEPPAQSAAVPAPPMAPRGTP
ncbi:MAG TPA: FtsH protease activity modulator HflK [Acetobacteraceae bacterium]|nr:FtsH protease activity modulator HflK [Acetobacteraceae bacterium]